MVHQRTRVVKEGEKASQIVSSRTLATLIPNVGGQERFGRDGVVSGRSDQHGRLSGGRESFEGVNLGIRMCVFLASDEGTKSTCQPSAWIDSIRNG